MPFTYPKLYVYITIYVHMGPVYTTYFVGE